MRKVKKSELTIYYEDNLIEYVFKLRIKNVLKKNKMIKVYSLFVFVRESDTNKMIYVIKIRS